MSKIFITGISTEVGKTIASAIIVEALKADYWKPVQSGDLENSDTDKVKRLITNSKTKFHKNSYALTTPMSPHAAALIDGIDIQLDKVTQPSSKNYLVIEGAGGLLVPLNDENTMMDIIKPGYKVIVISRHYLGSINHTLLTLKLLKLNNFDTAVVWNGDENKSTEDIIQKMSGVPIIGRINVEPYFDQNVIKEYAGIFNENKAFLNFIKN